MFTFTLAKVNKLGDNDPTYGQRYWGEVSDDLTPVSFNSKQDGFTPGSTITAEEKVMKQSAKGTQYWTLKKVKLIESSQLLESSETPPERPYVPHTAIDPKEVLRQLTIINSKLDQLLGVVQVQEDYYHGQDEDDAPTEA